MSPRKRAYIQSARLNPRSPRHANPIFDALSPIPESEGPCKKVPHLQITHLEKGVLNQQPASRILRSPTDLESPLQPTLPPSWGDHEKPSSLQRSKLGSKPRAPWVWSQVRDFPSQEHWMNAAMVTGWSPCLAGIILYLHLPGAVPTPWKPANPQTHMPPRRSQAFSHPPHPSASWNHAQAAPRAAVTSPSNETRTQSSSLSC